jgi:hypothetical protein
LDKTEFHSFLRGERALPRAFFPHRFPPKKRLAIFSHRRIAEVAAAGSQQFAGEFIVGFVGAHSIPDPAMVDRRTVGPEVDGKLRFHPQDIAPVHGLAVGETRSRNEIVDQPGAFVWRRFLQESDNLLVLIMLRLNCLEICSSFSF